MEKLWSFLVYLAGDNNLDPFATLDLLEMKRAGSNDAINVVAQVDSRGANGAQRFYLTPHRTLTEDLVESLPETNTGDPAALLDFIRWGLDRYPADRAALILWNHGNGWKDDDLYALARGAGSAEEDLPRSLVRGLDARPAGRTLFRTTLQSLLEYPAETRAILFDDTSKDFLDSRELRQVLDCVLAERRMEKLDLIGFDACLMSMVEVAAQVAPACRVMVGSQEVEPEGGWPYDRVLARLQEQPTATAAELAQMIVESFAASYEGAPPPPVLTQSAIQLNHIPTLLQAISRLADCLVEQLPDPTTYTRLLLPAAREVQKFRDQESVDLAHLAALLARNSAGSPIQEAALDLLKCFDPAGPESVLVASFSSDLDHTAAQGLSIYLPLAGKISPAYQYLDFAQQCRWPRLLEAFSVA